MKNDKGRGIPRGPSVFEITAEGLAAESATAWTPATMGRKGGSARTPAKTAALASNQDQWWEIARHEDRDRG